MVPRKDLHLDLTVWLLKGSTGTRDAALTTDGNLNSTLRAGSFAGRSLAALTAPSQARSTHIPHPAQLMGSPGTLSRSQDTELQTELC